MVNTVIPSDSNFQNSIGSSNRSLELNLCSLSLPFSLLVHNFSSFFRQNGFGATRVKFVYSLRYKTQDNYSRCLLFHKSRTIFLQMVILWDTCNKSVHARMYKLIPRNKSYWLILNVIVFITFVIDFYLYTFVVLIILK